MQVSSEKGKAHNYAKIGSKKKRSKKELEQVQTVEHELRKDK